jgi:hypothetical protein
MTAGLSLFLRILWHSFYSYSYKSGKLPVGMNMLKRIGILLLLLASMSLKTYAQKSRNTQPTVTELPPETDSLRLYETKLKAISDTMVDGKYQYNRIKALTHFIPTFVRALKFRGSYDYPFDSLRFMKKLSPPDNSFKIYSWILKYDDGTFRYYGAIQFHNEDTLKLVPMRDYSDKLDSAADQLTLSKDEWFGCFYYSIFPCKVKNMTYYILLGWDGNTSGSNKKIIDVLSFDANKKPIFGAPIFEKDGKTLDRVFFEFNEDASLTMNYIPEQNMIVVDHLVPPNAASEGLPFTYVPDGTYDYFIFKKGKWIFQNKDVFDNTKKPIKEAGDTPVIDEKKKAKQEMEKNESR